MDAIRRRLRSLFGSSSGSAKDPDDRRSDTDRRSGEERREHLSLPPVSEEQRSGSERRSGQDRRNGS